MSIFSSGRLKRRNNLNGGVSWCFEAEMRHRDLVSLMVVNHKGREISKYWRSNLSFCLQVGQMLQCLHKVFASKCPNGPSTSVNEEFEFEMRLEIREEDDVVENGYRHCPVETNCFKLRKDRKRRVIATLKQTKGPRSIRIRKCFGVLLAAGRYLRESDLQLLDSQEFKYIEESNAYEIQAVSKDLNDTATCFSHGIRKQETSRF